MLWVIGRILKYIIILAILITLIGLAVVFFFNPNNFKESINNQLKSYTGLPLQVKGDIKWALHPKAGIFLTDVTLPNQTNPNAPLISMKEVNVYIDPYSLFKQTLVVTSLQINNAVFAVVDSNDAEQNPSIPTLPTEMPRGSKIYSIQELQIKNANINVKNASTKLNLEIKDANIFANNLVMNGGGPLPVINLIGTLVDMDRNISTNINTGVKLDFAKQEIDLDPLTIDWNSTQLTGKASISNLFSSPAIRGDLTLDATDFNALLKKVSPYLANTNMDTNHALHVQTSYDYHTSEQILDLTNIALKLDDGTISGTCKISFQSPYRAEFAIIAENINFSPLKTLFDALFPGLPSDTLVSVDFFKEFAVAGKFSGSKLQFGAIQIEQTTLEVIGQNGLIQIQPFTISAYGGMHNLTVALDVNSQELPFFKITEQADEVTLEPWLKLINYTEVINGEAAIKASLEALGNNMNDLKQSLTGVLNMYVKNGVLYDIDLDKLMNFTAKTVNDVFDQLAADAGSDLYNLLRNKSIGWIDTQKSDPKTPFDNFEFKAEIKEGKSDKASISLTNSAYEMKATGGFDLIANQINFDALISYKTPVTSDVPELASFMKGAPLPLTISGTIQKPTFGPNIQNYAASVINLAQADIMNKALTIMLAKTPANGPTTKTASELFTDSLDGLNK